MYTQWRAHITNKNEVRALEGRKYNSRTHEYTKFNPNIEDMIRIVDDIRAQFDIDPYGKPLV